MVRGLDANRGQIKDRLMVFPRFFTFKKTSNARVFQGFVFKRRDLPGDSNDRQAVGPVGGDINVKHHIGKGQHMGNFFTGPMISFQNHNP